MTSNWTIHYGSLGGPLKRILRALEKSRSQFERTGEIGDLSITDIREAVALKVAIDLAFDYSRMQDDLQRRIDARDSELKRIAAVQRTYEHSEGDPGTSAKRAISALGWRRHTQNAAKRNSRMARDYAMLRREDGILSHTLIDWDRFELGEPLARCSKRIDLPLTNERALQIVADWYSIAARVCWDILDTYSTEYALAEYAADAEQTGKSKSEPSRQQWADGRPRHKPFVLPQKP